MRKSTIVAAFAIAIAAIVLLLVSRAPAPSFVASSAPIAATSTITASTTDYTVFARYPQFGITGIDAQIKQDVEKGIGDLEAQAQQDQPEKNGFPQYSFISEFSDAYVGDDFVSVRLVLAAYTGGAHELPTVVGENFHRDSGKRVSLAKALALTGRSLDQVASEVKRQLAQNPDTQPIGIWGPGSDSDPNNYQTFLIKKDAVVFIFQPYQVAPYSEGTPEVSIPRTK